MRQAHQALNLQFPNSQSTGSDASPLEEFRSRIEGSTLDISHHPYTLRHPQTSLYRGIFSTLGLLMLLLSLTVFFKSSNWILELHVGYGWFLKAFMGSFSAMMGIAALTLGLQLRTEKDVANQIWSDNKRKLSRLYRCRLKGAGGLYGFAFPANRAQSR